MIGLQPVVSLVNRRICIRILRLCRSAKDVLTCFGSGLPSIRVLRRRVMLRNRVKDRNSKLAGTAKQAGVKRFAIFHAAGIREMYRMRLTDIKARKGIGDDEDWLDRQAVEELAANEFRITQTDAKLRRENIHGEERTINAHAKWERKCATRLRAWAIQCPKICRRNRQSRKLRNV